MLLRYVDDSFQMLVVSQQTTGIHVSVYIYLCWFAVQVSILPSLCSVGFSTLAARFADKLISEGTDVTLVRLSYQRPKPDLKDVPLT